MADEIQNGFDHKAAMEEERDLINRTIGEILGHKVRGARVDAAETYRSMGGESEFTFRLFADTFGSRSAGTEGAISSDPSVDTPVEEITATLVKIATSLADEKLTSKAGRPAEVRRFDLTSGTDTTAYSCISVSIADKSEDGAAKDEDIQERIGPSTWIFTVPEGRG